MGAGLYSNQKVKEASGRKREAPWKHRCSKVIQAHLETEISVIGRDTSPPTQTPLIFFDPTQVTGTDYLEHLTSGQSSVQTLPPCQTVYPRLVNLKLTDLSLTHIL